jgi:hypothetical protein
MPTQKKINRQFLVVLGEIDALGIPIVPDVSSVTMR